MTEVKADYNAGRKLFTVEKNVGKDKNTWDQGTVDGKVSDKLQLANCENTLITVTSKLNQIMITNCKNCAVICKENVVGAVDVNNSKKVTVQVSKACPIVNVAKCQDSVVYLNRENMADIEVISEASSGCNIKFPGKGDDDDDVEVYIPEQISTKFDKEGSPTHQAKTDN